MFALSFEFLTNQETIVKIISVAVLSVLSGAALGAGVVQGLHAQAKPPSYVIVDVSAVTDAQGNAANTQRPNGTAAETFGASGGHYIVRTNKINPLDGTPPKRFIIARFDSLQQAQAWFNSPEQKKVNEIRMKTTKSRAFIVEGIE
jgi:uncharacterized protein (DUF1330 family)